MVKIPTFGQVHLKGASVDDQRKRQRTQPSVMSPGRDGMSRRAAKVKPGPASPPQGPDGRFRGPGTGDTPGLPGPQRVRSRPHRELVRPRYRLPEPKGDRILGDLLLATSCGDKQPLTSRTMCSSAVKITPDRPYRT